jgi:hypothetical protein
VEKGGGVGWSLRWAKALIFPPWESCVVTIDIIEKISMA